MTLTATDAAGNNASCSFIVTAADTTAPVITCPPTQLRDLSASCTYDLEELTALATTTDNCPGALIVTQSPAAGALTLTGPGRTTVTLTATDPAGNTGTCAFEVAVADATPPTIICPDPVVTQADANCTARTPDLTDDASAADNCSATAAIDITQDIAVNTVLTGEGTTQTVTLTATDAAGLSANCTVTVTVEDITPPILTCPAAQTLNLNATDCEAALPDYARLLRVTDNCEASAAPALQQMPPAGTVVSGVNTVQEVAFSAVDGSGNMATCSFEVTLRDVTPPGLTCPTDATLALNVDCSAPLPDFTDQTTATDACAMSDALVLTQSPGPGTSLGFDGATVSVTITARDGNGNSDNCSFSVIAEDVLPPMITCPADQDVVTDGGCAFELPDYTDVADVSDNCSQEDAITVTQSPGDGVVVSQEQLGVPQTVTLTATDAAGGVANCTFTVTPVDASPPSILCPPSPTIFLDADGCTGTIGDYTGSSRVTDNCTDSVDVVVTQSAPAGSAVSGVLLPDTVITLTATDLSGNTDTCNFRILIRDTIAPTVDCSAATQVIALDADCNGSIPDLTPALISDDNCSAGALTTNQDPAPGANYSGDGTAVTVLFTVIDANRNATPCTATVTFEDQSPPSPVTCPGDQELNVDDVCDVPLPDYTTGATVGDNCRAQNQIVVSQIPAPGTAVNLTANPTITVTLTADDGNGNTESCSFLVTLVDEEALDLTCPGGQRVVASADDCDGTLPDYLGDVLTVNQCMTSATGASLNQTPAPGTPLTLPDLDVPQTVSITATDLNGNTSQCTFEVTLVDTLPPTLTCPPMQADTFNTACSYELEDLRDLATVMDNCSPVDSIVLGQNPLPGGGFDGPAVDQVVTITATDGSGNRTQCTFELQVRDRTPPVVICPEPDTLFTNSACEVTVGDYTGGTIIQDNCAEREALLIEQVPPPGTVFSGHLTSETVTITATDPSGNVETCSFPLTAVDTIRPTVFCPGDRIVRPDADCNASLPDYRGQAKFDDNCTAPGAISLTQRPAAGTLLNGQGASTQVTLVADDGNGNLDSCTFVVTLEDDVPPTITCPGDRTVALDANCNYALANLREDATVTDNCTAQDLIVVSQNIGIGQTFRGDSTVISVTLTADDRNGNTAQCVTTITLEDTIPPTITCPAPQVVPLDDNCRVGLPDYRAAPVADNCTDANDIVVTQALTPGTTLSGDGEVETVVLTADDGNGNTTSCTFEVTLDDVTDPTIACPPDQEVFVDGSCSTSYPNFVALTTAADNCTASPAITQVPAAGVAVDTLGTQTITLTADDGNGNTTDCTFSLAVNDNTPPVLNCPPLSLIPADDNCTVAIADYRDSLTVTDNCGPTSVQAGAITLVQNPPAGSEITEAGTAQVLTITATDPSGNATNCNITVEVADTTRPTIVCPADTTLAVDDNCSARIPDYTGLPVVADNCSNGNGTDVIVVTQSPAVGTVVSNEASSITVILTATDPAGNFISCDFAVQLIDSIPPTVTCPLDRTLSLNADCSFTLGDYRGEAGATDNCSQTAEITYEQRPAAGEVFTEDGTVIPVTIVATDQSGNQDSCLFDITLDDVTDPVIRNCPSDSAVFVDAVCSYVTPDFWMVSTVTATDNCTASGTTATTATGEQLTYSQLPAVGTAFSGGMTTETVTLTVDDGNGNAVSCSFELSLSDTISPVITVCPSDTTANPDAACEFTLGDYTDRAVATDNCVQDGPLTFTQRPAPGTVAGGQGTVEEITITARDASGNTTNCTFTLSLQDTIAPAITCPDARVQSVDTGCSVELADYTNQAETDDNCSPAAVTVSQLPAPGTDFTGVQVQTVTLTADDGNGNSSACTFEVGIEDAIDPVLTCPATSTIPATAACEVTIASYVDSVSVTDNCDDTAGITLSQDVAVGTTIEGLGVTQRVTVTAEDRSGNTDQCVITVRLVDTIRPSLACVPDTTLGVDAGCNAVLPDYTSVAVVMDNCNGPAEIAVVQAPAPDSPLSTEGATQDVTITATDASGNSTSCTFTVTLIDTIDPVVVCPPNDTIGVDGGCEVMIPDYTLGARPTDNCTDPDAIALLQEPPPGTLISGDGTMQTITITATDASGNSSMCTLTVTLEDTTEPIIGCPVDQELTADDDCAVPIPDYTGDASVSSSCEQGDDIAVTQEPAPGTLISGHNTTEEITLTATDNVGNFVTCSFLVTLIDRTAPEISDCPTAPITEQVDGDCEFLLLDYWRATKATATDNCRPGGVASTTAAANQIDYTQVPPPGTVLESGMGSQVITLTADDTHGNQTSCQVTVVLQDTIRPEITLCPPDTVANPNANCDFTLEDYTTRARAMDNCGQDGPIVLSQLPAPGTVVSGDGGVSPITITATDANGNQNSCAFMLTLNDTISPAIDCPVDQTETLGANCTDAIQDYTGLAVVADNCTDPAGIRVTQLPAPGAVFSGVQAQTITLTADDGNGNTTSCAFELNIVDDIDPELTCPPRSTIPADDMCEADVISYLDSVTVTDNCDAPQSGITLTQDVAVGETIVGLGAAIDVTVTATDASGNTDQCVIEIVLLDTVAPVLTCVPDTVLGVDGSCGAVLPDYRPVAAAVDNCGETGPVTFSQLPAPGTAYSDETTSFGVNITATDATGNATSCTFRVQLIDTIAPTVVCPGSQIVEVDDDCTISLADYLDQATPDDNCSENGSGEITLVQRPAPGATFSGEATTTPVTVIATDQSGNVDSCTFTVELDDVTPPAILDCQTDTIGIVDAGCSYTLPDYWMIAPASSQDNCTATGTPATTAAGDQIIYTQDPPPGTVLTDAFATQRITLTADDGNGNTASCDFLLTLTDTTSPTIVCPTDTVANPNANCDFALEDYTGRANVADNCTAPADLVVTQDPPIGTVFTGQATEQEITLTVTDPSGNESSCTFLLTLQDSISPSIVCPLPKVETLDAACDFTVPDYTGEDVVNDNCTDPEAIVVTQTPLAGTVIADLNEGDMVTVTLTADDGNGNAASCNFSVTLDDVTDPVVTCPADSTVFVDAGCSAELPDLVSVTTATDNCAAATGGDGLTITQAPPAATSFSDDDTEIVVLLTADDGNGNTAQCQVTVTLRDTTPPSIICPPGEVLMTDAACEVMLPDYTVRATVADNCTANGNISIRQDVAAGTTFSGQGTTQTVTLTADDGNGNTNSCALDVTVDDGIAPTIVCPPTETQFVTANCEVVLQDYTDLAVPRDNCTSRGAIVVTQVPLSGTSFNGVQTTVVTLTADDGNGNTTDCDFTVRFDDNTVPTIICPPSQEIAFGTDCQFTLPDFRELAVIDDNCTAASPLVTQSPSIDSVINDLGTVTAVTLTAEDASGNTSRCQFVVTNVSPTPPPVLTTVALAVVPPPVGTGLVNLRDALDPNAVTNLSGIDLDRDGADGPGPYLVSYYANMEEASAESGQIDEADYDPALSGEVVIARLEDPATGCFRLSQILLNVRTPGVSGAIDATSCSRPGTVIRVDGLPQSGGRGTSVVRHQWRIIDDGETSIETADLIDADQQVVGLPTGEATGSGTVVLEYQFFEEYGDGPVVPSVPKTVAIEILNVGGGEFFWNGSPKN